MEKIEFWEDRDKGIVHIKLLSDKAEEFALLIAKDMSRKTNKRTQIRKFYDEVAHLNMEAVKSDKKPDGPDKKLDGPDKESDGPDKEWNAILVLVNMLVAKAAYARGRDLVSDNFLAFIKNSVAGITERKDLKLFASFFEAFMGFYRLHGSKS